MTALQLSDFLGAAPTIETRIAVTVVLLAALALLGWLSGHARTRFEVESASVERVLNAGGALGLFALSLVVGWVILGLWEVSPLQAFGISEPFAFLSQVVVTVALALAVYVLTGVVKRFIHEFTADRQAITRHQTELLFRTVQVTLYGLALVAVFGVWRVNLGGLLVGAGFLGIVVGLAARQTLGALIAGFVLMFSRPFEIGDWVEVDDREGIVTEITIVNTRIETFDGEYAMIPNDVVSSNEIVNRTRKGRLRVRVEVGVDYGTDLDRAADVATGAMRDVEEILSVPRPQVVFRGFGDSAVLLELRFWIDKPSARRRWRAQTAVVAAVKAAFDREGIKIPFPQRELMSRVEEGGFRLAGEAPEGIAAAPNGSAGTDGDDVGG